MSTRRFLILSAALAALLLLSSRLLSFFVDWSYRGVDPNTRAVSRARAFLQANSVLPFRTRQVWIVPQPGYRYVMLQVDQAPSWVWRTVRVNDDGRCVSVDEGP